MGTILEHLTTGKLVKFIASIPTLGAGTLHVVEDLETGFSKILAGLEEYKIHAEQDVQQPDLEPTDDDKVEPAKGAWTAPQVQVRATPAGLPSVGTDPLPAAAVNPTAGLPPLGG